MPAIARVEPLTTARALRGPFDYLLPEAMGHVGVGSILKVPFGHQRMMGVVVEVAAASSVAPEKLVAPLEALELGVAPELVGLALRVAEEYCSTPARALGLVLPPKGNERTGLVAELTDAGRAAIGTDADGPRVGERQRAALEALAAGPVAATGLPADHGALRRLQARGLIEMSARARPRRPGGAGVGARRREPPPLTAEQASALETVTAALGTGHAELLLHGVTGSGKTEVYLRAADTALRGGRGVIVLVPEIALTPQIVARFRDRFGDTVAVLHSKLSAGERHDEWLRLRRGEARVAVGPRSAVFAPVSDLGLIVVDEEHDASYKHEGDPRYDARRVAAMRARDAGAVLVAGSATPRPESVHALQRIRLAQRVDGQPLPAVEVLDMRGIRGALHPDTTEALAGVRRAGRKAIVLLNRRGWSNFLSCQSCGRAWECPQCDVTLVLHRSAGTVSCHHCGHVERAPQSCPDCGSQSVTRHGAGTERLEHDLREALGGEAFPVFRLDSDTAAHKGAIERMLARFEAADAGVLVGTQMVAKGHDFPDVALGVVLDADATLRFPDFRAEERTFALVAQLAGRAGRGARDGRVLVQTMAPDARAILLAARHDADGFLAEELARRKALSYPPFADLIRVVCSSDSDAAPAAATEAAAAVRAALGELPSGTVLGPAPLFRLRGRVRSQLVVKSADRVAVVRLVGAAVGTVAADRIHKDASFAVDVDPQ
jgi:primosomal protein N' (replication factor Y)